MKLFITLLLALITTNYVFAWTKCRSHWIPDEVTNCKILNEKPYASVFSVKPNFIMHKLDVLVFNSQFINK